MEYVTRFVLRIFFQNDGKRVNYFYLNTYILQLRGTNAEPKGSNGLPAFLNEIISADMPPDDQIKYLACKVTFNKQLAEPGKEDL